MGVSQVSYQLQTIADALRDSSDSDHVAIRKTAHDQIEVVKEVHHFFLSAQHAFWEVVAKIFSLFGKTLEPSSPIKFEDKETTKQYFEEVFGQKRLSRFDKKHTLQLEDNQKVFVRGDVRKVFVSSGEITVDDLQELFSELKDISQNRLRFFSERETDRLRLEYHPFKALGDCPQDKVDRLVQILSPFAKIEHLFVHNLPLQYVNMWSENEWINQQKRVYTYHMIKPLDIKDPLWALYVAKELSSRDIPPSALVPHSHGYHYNFQFIRKGGERKYFMKVFSTTTEKTKSYMLYQGTVPFCSESRRNVMHPQFGTPGPLATYNETHALLHNPDRGFVQSEDEQVDVVGMSLGGAQAQLAKLLYGKKIREVTTVCSPGLDKASLLLYKMIMQGKTYQDKFVYIFENDDLLDGFGAGRLGHAVDPSKAKIDVYVRSSGSGRYTYSESFWIRLSQILVSSFASHLKPVIDTDTRLTKYSNENAEDKKAIQEALMHSKSQRDPKWDKFRRTWSKRLGYDNKRDFLKVVSKSLIQSPA